MADYWRLGYIARLASSYKLARLKLFIHNLLENYFGSQVFCSLLILDETHKIH